MSRTLRFDGEGNDVTPMCEIADGLVLDDGCGECALKNDCPGYYDGCFDAVNGVEPGIGEIISVLELLADGAEECAIDAREPKAERKTHERHAEALRAAIDMLKTRSK